MITYLSSRQQDAKWLNKNNRNHGLISAIPGPSLSSFPWRHLALSLSSLSAHYVPDMNWSIVSPTAAGLPKSHSIINLASKSILLWAQAHIPRLILRGYGAKLSTYILTISWALQTTFIFSYFSMSYTYLCILHIAFWKFMYGNPSSNKG